MTARPRSPAIRLLALCAPLVLAAPLGLEAQNLKELTDLSGVWRFHLGDDLRWAAPTFDDNSWSSITVPGAWEDQGYPGYDGFAWYRTSFTPRPQWSGKSLVASLGRIDDVDEVYLNGTLIGARGSLPPDYQTAYDQVREYPIPEGLLQPGRPNVLAVRVYDGELGGGIVNGPVGIWEDRAALRPDEPIVGVWRFATGDKPEWKDPRFDDKLWHPIFVPTYWEQQGYKDYDGFAWYRIRFRVGATTASRDMILLLGKIDDVDETYLNGRLIGRTGKIHSAGDLSRYAGEYERLRAYTVPAGVLTAVDENVIAVRVHDPWRNGGIYQGPIGFVRREKYLNWERGKNQGKGARDAPEWIRDFFEGLFRREE
jgi:sialate O-acetylesterase